MFLPTSERLISMISIITPERIRIIMNKAFIGTILLFSLAALCNANCSEHSKHYSELGCIPIKDQGDDCPNRYDCTTLRNRDSQKCHFNGHTYEPGTSLSQSDQELVPCSPACVCMNHSHSSPAFFHCESNECPELSKRELNCVYQYTMGQCCATGPAICGKDIEELGKCYFEGKMYRVGEKMFPDLYSFYKCYCVAGFDNSTVVGNPNCYEINCGIELRSAERLAHGCIPVYFGTDRRCPIRWRCPEDKDTVIEGGSRAAHDSKMQCEFGNLTMDVGDSISSEDKCLSCKCTIPPMAHCILARACW